MPTSTTSAEETSTFLRLLIDRAETNLHFLLWLHPGKESRWFTADPTGVEEAIHVATSTEDRNVYVGGALDSEPRGRNKRVTNTTAAALLGVWADIDIASNDPDIHKKPNLPPDESSAVSLLHEALPQPTMIVHSGNGLQAWWLFTRCMTIESEEDRRAAQALCFAWNRQLQNTAHEHGWDVDAIHDLARVMRVPGTWNHKGAAEPKVVRLLETVAERRYSPEEMRASLPPGVVRFTQSGLEFDPTDAPQHSELSADPRAFRYTSQVDDLRLSAGASPPFEKWEALRATDKKVERTWKRERSDLRDQSPSSYDMALATWAAMASWTDQEIVDLLIAHRRKHGDDPKLRHDYYARTIAKARDSAARDQATEVLEESLAALESAHDDEDPEALETARKNALENASKMLGVKIDRIVKYTQDPPKYRLETPGGSIMLGNAQTILNQHQMRAHIAAATSHLIPKFKGEAWDSIAESLFKACIEQDTGYEASDAGTAYNWVVDYILDNPPSDDREEAMLTQHPYTDEEGAIYIFGPALRRWLNVARGEKVSPQRMGEMLRAYGAEPRSMNIAAGDLRTTRSVWRITGIGRE